MKKELIIKDTLLSYIATHALIITEQMLAQYYSSRFEQDRRKHFKTSPAIEHCQ